MIFFRLGCLDDEALHSIESHQLISEDLRALEMVQETRRCQQENTKQSEILEQVGFCALHVNPRAPSHRLRVTGTLTGRILCTTCKPKGSESQAPSHRYLNR